METVCRVAFGARGRGNRVVLRVDIEGLRAPEWSDVDVALACGPGEKGARAEAVVAGHFKVLDRELRTTRGCDVVRKVLRARYEDSQLMPTITFEPSPWPSRLDTYFGKLRTNDAIRGAIDGLLSHAETSLRCAQGAGPSLERPLNVPLPTKSLDDASYGGDPCPRSAKASKKGGCVFRRAGTALRVVVSLPDPDLDTVTRDMSALLRRCVPAVNHAYPSEVLVLLGDRDGAVTYESSALSGAALVRPCKRLALDALEAFHAANSLPKVRPAVATGLLNTVECLLGSPPRTKTAVDVRRRRGHRPVVSLPNLRTLRRIEVALAGRECLVGPNLEVNITTCDSNSVERILNIFPQHRSSTTSRSTARTPATSRPTGPTSP